MSSEWNLIEAFIVRIPSINTATGEEGRPGRLVTASEEKAKALCAAVKGRSYRRATEADLTPGEIASLRRAAAEAEAASTGA